MKMKNSIPTVAVAWAAMLGFTATSMAEPDKGEAMTKALCMACHGNTQAGQARQAPPMMMVKRHYEGLGEKEMIKAIAKWVKKPDAKKARMRGAVRRFGLMPPLALPDADLKAIAQYISKTKFDMPNGCGPGAGGRGKRAIQKKSSNPAGCDPANCDPTQCDPTNCQKSCGKKPSAESSRKKG